MEKKSPPREVQRPSRGTLPGTPQFAAPAQAAAKPSPPREVQRPSRGTLPGAPLFAAPTMHGEVPSPNANEAIFELNAPMPAAAALAKVAELLQQIGGRVIERGKDSLRALLAIDCHGLPRSSIRAQAPQPSSSSHLALTEMEAQFVIGVERQIHLTLRPMAPLSPSVSTVWRSGCQRIGSELQALLLS
jgi:hypothetical protein